jgi:hypothetical protein
MSKNLYWLRMIMDAFNAPGREKALGEAFRAIVARGQAPAYAEGLRQFEAFMEEVGRQALVNERDLEAAVSALADNIIISLATGAFGGSKIDEEEALAFISSRATWKEKLESVRADLRAETEPRAAMSLTVARDGVDIETVPVSSECLSHSIKRVLPGHYELKLSTGLLLWEDELGQEDIEWSAAFPGHALDFAAATEELEGKPTREVSVLDGEILLQIFPGVEAGRMVITFMQRGKF